MLKVENKQDAVEKWVESFNSYPLSMVLELQSISPETWRDITPSEEKFEPSKSWGTIWAFKSKPDNKWLETHLSEMADCGFFILESEQFGYFFGTNSHGIDFYVKHWSPLYDARGLLWHETLKTSWYDEMRRDADIIAYKLWKTEDVACCLAQEGYKKSEENICLVSERIKAWYLNILEDCTDSEWNAFSWAILDCKDELEKYEE